MENYLKVSSHKDQYQKFHRMEGEKIQYLGLKCLKFQHKRKH